MLLLKTAEVWEFDPKTRSWLLTRYKITCS